MRDVQNKQKKNKEKKLNKTENKKDKSWDASTLFRQMLV